MYTIRGTWMRGGTSKCWLFNAVDIDPLVSSVGDLDTILTSAFGSGDPRQLDGIGGGSSTTSKAAIVRRSNQQGIDIDYLFAQVAIAERTVEWGSNCGNCATAIGLYAVQAGLVPVQGDTTRVRMRNENTGAVLVAEVATAGGRVPYDGDATVPGATAPGVPVGLTFENPAGSPAHLLPTGSPVDVLQPGRAPYRATLVSAGAPAALVDPRNTDLGLHGAESPRDMTAAVPALVSLRREAALQMGLSRPEDPITHAIPKIGVASPAVDYTTTSGDRISAGDYDVSIRMLSMMAPHPAIGLTSAVAAAAAASVQGTIIDRLTAHRISRSSLRIGTAAGIIPVDISTDDNGNLTGVTLHRAARRIATAELFVSPLVRELAHSA
ncbi:MULTISPECIES: PrpF domain-containing protein [Citricoccus]|uniref:PrpF domain-containing protein n=1 Tax=Citricoccus TaxID=169133 RepID=UPI000255F63A|nr:PrpF domain-containing protein [Citricoccus sp. CH26A]